MSIYLLCVIDAEPGYQLFYNQVCSGRNEIASGVGYNRRSLCREKCDENLGCMSFEWKNDKCYLSATCAPEYLVKEEDSLTYVKEDYGAGIYI